MVITTRYITSDNQAWKTKAEAKKHEDTLINQNLKPEILEMISKILLMLNDVDAIDNSNRIYDDSEYLGMLKTILTSAASGEDADLTSHLTDYYNSNC